MFLPFVQAADEDTARQALGDLLAQHASPLVRRIVGRQLGASARAGSIEQDHEDVHATVLLRLTAQCWLLRRGDAAPGIASLAAYVAATTYNTCHEWLRTRAPRRARVQNRIRYVLTRDQRLALWEVADREWLCGLRSAQAAASAGTGTQTTVRSDAEVLRCVQMQWAAAANRVGPGGGAGSRGSGTGGRGAGTGARGSGGAADSARVDANADAGATPRAIVLLVHDTLAALGAPCRFGDLVSAVAETLREIDDEGRGHNRGALRLVRSRDEAAAAGDPAEQVQDTSASPAEVLEHRDYLARLWAEIVLLPPRQRAALLFNLRDEHGGGMLALLPITGVASMADIARALELSDARLAELWSTFPRDDQWIAEYLGLTRRQVINLRKCARARLARRMGAQDAAPAGNVTPHSTSFSVRLRQRDGHDA